MGEAREGGEAVWRVGGGTMQESEGAFGQVPRYQFLNYMEEGEGGLAGSEVVGVLGPDSLVVEHPLMRAAMLELNTTPPFLLNHSFYTSCTTETH